MESAMLKVDKPLTMVLAIVVLVALIMLLQLASWDGPGPHTDFDWALREFFAALTCVANT
jgi:hypothetical protein